MSTKTHLSIGDKAPMFCLKDQNGEDVCLKDFEGRKVVIFFYPKDDTPGCTKAACSIRDHYDAITNVNAVTIGISPDKEAKHKKFIDKYGLKSTLLADTEKEVLQLYGVWGEKKFMGRTYDGVIRTTFIIDENGLILHIFDKVKTAVHGEQILEVLSPE